MFLKNTVVVRIVGKNKKPKNKLKRNQISNTKNMLARLRTSVITGIVVIAPVALTIWLIWSVIGWFDGLVLPFVPDAY